MWQKVSAQNAPAWVGDAVCQSLMGRQLLGAAVDSDDGWDVAPDGLPEGLSEGESCHLYMLTCIYIYM